MSTPEPGLESTNAETTVPRTNWRSPRTWVSFAADAVYSGAVAGVITITACLAAGLLHELKAGSFEGWWLVVVVMVALSGVHLKIVDRWLLPGKAARLFGLLEALPGGRVSTLLGALTFGLSLTIGLGLIALAQRLFALPDAWELQLMTLLIAMVINEGALFKLLFHRARNNLGN